MPDNSTKNRWKEGGGLGGGGGGGGGVGLGGGQVKKNVKLY